MKLTVLVDNNTFIDQYYLGEPAVSYYIEDEEIRLLFDTGYSDIFIFTIEWLCCSIHSIIKSSSYITQFTSLPFPRKFRESQIWNIGDYIYLIIESNYY